MCSNYRPVTHLDRLLTFFGVERDPNDAPPDLEVWPTGLAPFIRLHPDWDGNGLPALLAIDGLFGLLPRFATEVKYGKHTYNARSETVASLPSFRESWREGMRCIVPAEHLFEPCYESGAAVRWRIAQPGAVPFGIAGIYYEWTHAQTGEKQYSFAMLTVNADTHPLYKTLQAPDKEKRMPVILEPSQYTEWLTCGVTDAPKFFRQWLGVFEAGPDPLPARAPKPKVAPIQKAMPKPKPPAAPTTGDLFE